MDAVGVFGYSDEDGTQAATYDGKVASEDIDERVARVSALVEELTAQRAEDRVGSVVEVLVEEQLADGGVEGRAAQQGPEVDGTTTLVRPVSDDPDDDPVGRIVPAVVTGSAGIDLYAEPLPD